MAKDTKMAAPIRSRSRGKKNNLTPSQAEFCHSYVLGKPGVRLSGQMCYFIAFGWEHKKQTSFEELSGRDKILAHEYGKRLLQTPKIDRYIEVLRDQQEIETDQARGSYLARSIEMRDQMMENNAWAAAAKMHRDIGEVLGHYTTRIEISEAPQSGDILTQIGELIRTNPELQRLAISTIAESASALRMLDQVVNAPPADAIPIKSTTVEPEPILEQEPNHE